MPGSQSRKSIIDQLQKDIASDVGNTEEPELQNVADQFTKSLNELLSSFNADSFDQDGFIRRMQDLRLNGEQDQQVVRTILNNIRTDYVNVESINQNELLLRRDIHNVCTQMPEMHDVIQVTRDAIIECNVSTGEVSRSITFENHDDDDALLTQVTELEKRHELLMGIKNFITPKTLEHGELYVQVTPYAKLFAELESISMSRNKSGKQKGMSDMHSHAGWMEHVEFQKSCPEHLLTSFEERPHSMYSEENVKVLMESVSLTDVMNGKVDSMIQGSTQDEKKPDNTIAKSVIGDILRNIDVYNHSSVLLSEYGAEGFRDLVTQAYLQEQSTPNGSENVTHFDEAQYNNGYSMSQNIFRTVDEDCIDISNYKDIKGCYVKYLDALRLLPIRLDRRVIGYYYATTTMDLQTNSANPNGIIDLSYQNYVRDKRMVDQLANMIIRSFDKKMLERNVQLKSEIAEIIMAHKFSEGKLSFIYIPEDEVVRFVINEDENGRGHSILEPSLFSARMYLMLNMYNMLYTLNNNTTRIHYLRSSGLDNDYASQVQRTIRKFQSRRITIDDIFSYSGVLNKVGGMGEMVLPSGRNDYKALETDTIEAAQNPINVEFLEQQRRQAISGTGVPSLLVINAIDEVDFAKTLEIANTRFLSTVSSYKIDMNRGMTKLYQKLLQYETSMEKEVIQSFRFQFNQVKQPDLVITADMIQNFNTMVELVESVYFSQNELEDQDKNPTSTRMFLRKEMAMEFLPQLNFDRLDQLVDRVKLQAGEVHVQNIASDIQITQSDIDQVSKS